MPLLSQLLHSRGLSSHLTLRALHVQQLQCISRRFDSLQIKILDIPGESHGPGLRRRRHGGDLSGLAYRDYQGNGQHQVLSELHALKAQLVSRNTVRVWERGGVTGTTLPIVVRDSEALSG